MRSGSRACNIRRAWHGACAAVRTSKKEHTIATQLPRRVLLVDDDKDVLALFKAVLELSGFSVTAASEGGAAAKFHRDAGAFDLLITDIDMPGQTGFELADALSLKQPNLPVLFITGGSFSDSSFVEQPRQILQKPLSARMLLASVDKILSTS